MEIDINLQLRSEILDIALNLEQNVNSLLLVLLSIENPQRKAITNKSGNLSFKNKIDLLFDLDVLNSDEHKKLLLLMEFRNQFLHNIECSSFENAVKLLGADKEKKLLKFDDADDNQDKELRYKCAFRNLYFESLKIISEKIEDRKNQIENRRKTHVKLIESQVFFIDNYFDILNKIMLICENNVSEIPEVIQLINQLSKTVTDDMELAFSSEKFTQIQNELKELHTPERIKAYFKR
jgi:hypothetical protein